MSLNTVLLNRLQKIQVRDKCLFDGYIRNNCNIMIPSEIVKICLLFYVLIEQWDEKCKSKDIRIDGDTIEKIKTHISWQRSAYLSNTATEGIHCWRFKIDQYSGNWTMLGVWKIKCKPMVPEKFCTANYHSTYAYIISKGSKTVDGGNEYSYGIECKNGDVVEMELDLKQLTLSYKVNDKDYSVAYEIEKASYKAVATLVGSGSKITLLSYQGY
eukprot:496999_1